VGGAEGDATRPSQLIYRWHIVSYMRHLSQVDSLQEVRATLWPALARMGTVRTDGAFYFLVPLPKEVGIMNDKCDGFSSGELL